MHQRPASESRPYNGNTTATALFGGGVGFGGFVGVFAHEVESGRFFCGKLCGFRDVFDRRGGGHFRQQLQAAVVLETRTGRDETAHDDVFLEAAEIVHLAGDSRFGEDASRLLEAGGGDERIGRERSLGDAKEERTARCGAHTFADDAIVFLAEAELVDLFLEKEVGVAHVFDFDTAHHLTNDGFDVLVIDVDALEAVDLLNGVDEIGLREFFAEDGQQVVQVGRTVDDSFAGFDVFAFLNVDVDAARNRIFLAGLAVFAFDVDFAHTLSDFAVANDAVDFADDGRVLGFAGFEEFDDARETTGDVFRFGGFTRDLGQDVARLNVVSILDH